jgi:hypothetical protein
MHHSIVSFLAAATLLSTISTADVVRESAAVSVAAFSGHVYRDRVYVRFINALSVRERAGELSELRGVPLPKVPGVTWRRLHEVSDDALQEQREQAEKFWQRELPDLRNEFVMTLAPGADLAKTIDALRQMPEVAAADPLPLPVAPPLPPDYRGSQQYLNASPVGTAPSLAWTWPGGRGQAVRVTDLEYGYNLAHEDLPAITRIGALGNNPFDNNHGTAVLSILFGSDNGWGVVGGVPDAAKSFAYCYFNTTGYNLAGAITSVSVASAPGDVLLIEQQAAGPSGGTAYVPSEWSLPVYNATVQAVGAGRIVVAAAGNGGENLDGPAFNTGHRPFIAANNSGAIVVGAGAAGPNNSPSTTSRSRLSFSCYGSRLSLQGWGERVYAAGYGSAFSAEGVNRYFTSGFNGTSSASPTVVNAAAVVSSVYETVTGTPINPLTLRAALVSTGAAQTSGANPATQNIGPLPNAVAALYQVLATGDCNQNQIPDRVDIAMGMADVNGDLIPDECQTLGCDDIDFNNNGVFPEDQDITDFFAVLAGASCPTCNDIDFNNNGVFPEDQDVVDFFNVLAGGTCG